MTQAPLELRPPFVSETAALLSLAVSTGLFSAEDADGLLGGVLQQFHEGQLPPGHHVVLAAEDGVPTGWVYFAPDDHSSGVWNLWWIGVAPAHHGAGVGLALLRHVESVVQAAGARILIIETSSLDALARARRFYTREGYVACGHIPDFYSKGETKIIFVKQFNVD